VRKVLLILSVIIAAPAVAQPAGPVRTSVPAGRTVAGLSDPHTRLSTAPGDTVCLISKKTHRKVCKSRAGWRKEASRLSTRTG